MIDLFAFFQNELTGIYLTEGILAAISMLGSSIIIITFVLMKPIRYYLLTREHLATCAHAHQFPRCRLAHTHTSHTRTHHTFPTRFSFFSSSFPLFSPPLLPSLLSLLLCNATTGNIPLR